VSEFVSDPTDARQLCTTCIAEVGAAASRGVITLHSNVTDADDRQRVIREAQAADTDGDLCSRCALRPRAAS
jgi:hypothetical protein